MPETVASAPPSEGREPIDLLVRGRIRTLDPQGPTAGVLAVRAGRVVATGHEQLERRFDPRWRLDVGGRAIIPGLVDAHLHLNGIGRSLEQVNLSGARSSREVVELVREAAARLPPGEMLLGRGWNQQDWEDTALPHHRPLSEAVPDRVVLLRRVDHHATLANARAMEAAGLGREARDPAGGEILRDREGHPSGVFVDAAADLLPKPPAPDPSQAERWLLAGQDACLAAGLTSVHDAGADEATLDACARLSATGRLVLGGSVMLEGQFDDGDRPAPWLAERLAAGPRRGRQSFASVKIYADGALGSRGAALLRPYADDPGRRGLLRLGRASLVARLRACRDAGFQANVHAIGDAANRLVLDAMEEVLGPGAAALDHRWRVEHAQVIHPADLPRFAALGVIASVQPVHATSDGAMAEQRLGASRLDGAYAWRSLLRAGARLALGSDAPIESQDPFAGLHAAVTRQDRDGRPWRAHEALDREEALAGFTTWAAFAAFQEGELGSLAPGARADFLVLPEDPVTCAPDRLRTLRPDSTWIEGREVWCRS
jgi:predicted amidohydrolase YtcJ